MRKTTAALAACTAIFAASTLYLNRQVQQLRLVGALGEERRRYIDELLQSGAMPAATFTAGTFATWPSTARGVEEKVGAAQEYQRRMRERASRILQPEQLAVFARIQEDWLASMRASWGINAPSDGAQ